MDEIKIESGRISIKTDRCPACNCKENKIKVDESKVYKIAVRMVKEGKI